MQAQWQDRLHAAFRQLPAREQQVLRLYYDEDYSTATIADIVRLDRSGVTRALQRGVRLLQQALEVGGQAQERSKGWCRHGHRLTRENITTFQTTRGYVQHACKACARARKRQHRKGFWPQEER